MLKEKYCQSIFSPPVEIAPRNLVLRLVWYFNFFFTKHSYYVLDIVLSTSDFRKIKTRLSHQETYSEVQGKVEMRAIKCHVNIGIKDEVHRRDSGDIEEEVVILYSGKKKEPGILVRGCYV